MTSEADGQVGRTSLHARCFTPNGNTVVLELHGDCDVAEQATLRSLLGAALDSEHRAVVVDLGHVTFCDVACARELFAAATHVELTLAGQRGMVQQLFEIIDPDQRLPRYRTLTAALGQP